MNPTLVDKYNVRAKCPNCDGAISNFLYRDSSGREFGYITLNDTLEQCDECSSRNGNIIFRLLSCSSCSYGAVAKYFQHPGSVHLLEFFPESIDILEIPKLVPKEIESEFREAEKCASVGARRGACALLRSTLEKILNAHGYTERYLSNNIANATKDGVITKVLSERASEVIKLLGDEVMHKDWREISYEEYVLTHGYCQRIMENFYDSPELVKIILKETKETESKNNQKSSEN